MKTMEHTFTPSYVKQINIFIFWKGKKKKSFYQSPSGGIFYPICLNNMLVWKESMYKFEL